VAYNVPKLRLRVVVLFFQVFRLRNHDDDEGKPLEHHRPSYEGWKCRLIIPSLDPLVPPPSFYGEPS
jgi:hypothetical protein